MAQLRTWLSRHDRLLGDQPDVDQVLRELGVTHRLLRDSTASPVNSRGSRSTLHDHSVNCRQLV
ncbi:MAG: hypothetical protein R3C56_22465 [Pirellulaceae bacterium]